MEIYFCSHCNQSIPIADLESGEAIRRGDRLLCTTCRYLHPPSEPRRSRSWTFPLAMLAVAVVVSLALIGMRLLDDEPTPRRVPARAQEPGNAAVLARLALLEQHVRQSLDRLQRDVQTGAEAREQDLTTRLVDHTAELTRLTTTVNKLEARPAPAPAISPQDLSKLKSDVSGILYEVEFLRDELKKRGGAPVATRRAGTTPTTTGGKTEGKPEASAAAASEKPAEKEKPAEPVTAASIMDHWLTRLQAKDPSSRLEAIEGLATLRGSRVVQALIGRLRDWSPAVRQRAAEDLGDRRADEARAALVKLLEDNDPSVRQAGVDALRAITGRFFGFESKASNRQRTRALEQWQRFVSALERKEKG